MCVFFCFIFLVLFCLFGVLFCSLLLVASVLSVLYFCLEFLIFNFKQYYVLVEVGIVTEGLCCSVNICKNGLFSIAHGVEMMKNASEK